MESAHRPPSVVGSPEARARIISTSLKAFVFGLFGLLPLLGFLPGCYAVILWFRLPKNVWNPARKYSNAGALMGSWGMLSTALAVWAIVISIVLSVS